MTNKKIKINRAPVLTLWAAVAGLNSQGNCITAQAAGT